MGVSRVTFFCWAQEVLMAIMIRSIHLQIYLCAQRLSFAVIEQRGLFISLVIGNGEALYS